MSNDLESQNPKPLTRIQAFLVELQTTIGLLRNVLLELKDLLLVIASIMFFVLGIVKVLGY